MATDYDADSAYSRVTWWRALPVAARARVILGVAALAGVFLRDVHLMLGVLGLWGLLESGNAAVSTRAVPQ